MLHPCSECVVSTSTLPLFVTCKADNTFQSYLELYCDQFMAFESRLDVPTLVCSSIRDSSGLNRDSD